MIYGNEPISPTPIAGGDNSVVSIDQVSYTSKGLTIRQYFAAMALQGLVSNDKAHALVKETGLEDAQEIIARAAVYLADALIKELNKSNQ